MQETYQRDLAQSGPYAFRDYVRWSTEEDARLLESHDVSAPDLAEELGRSIGSIYMRRTQLRQGQEASRAGSVTGP